MLKAASYPTPPPKGPLGPLASRRPSYFAFESGGCGIW